LGKGELPLVVIC